MKERKARTIIQVGEQSAIDDPCRERRPHAIELAELEISERRTEFRVLERNSPANIGDPRNNATRKDLE